MKILLDLVAPSPLEIAWGMFSVLIPIILVAAVVIVAAVLVIKAVKKKK
ncbi:MAG: hypothetical protein IKL18_01540 [Oscillospiraceae bacterium]|nr:hypothetical protein [Oscillospiraceae bacterium]MBR3962663.1 hypothetical protein [Oscillospiraceae bacterium]MBR6656837.1 hypothetical protein [Oscillospiraceae bacterium]